MDLPVEIGAGIGQVQIADLALDGQRGLGEAVVVAVREEMLDLEVADASDRSRTSRALRWSWPNRLAVDRPIVVEIDAQRGAAADHVDVVDNCSRPGDALLTVMPPGLRQEGAGAGDVVDIAGVVLVPADQAQRRACR